MRRRLALALALLVLFACSGPEGQPAPPLLGVNVTEYTGGDPPNCYGASVLKDYGRPRVRALVRDQLAAMRAGGAESIRLFLTYDYDASETPYFVPARSGRLEEPWRTNLINYLSDARAAGFLRLTLAFDPRYSVQPAQVYPNNDYNPGTFDESWSLIRDVRPLVKQYGPPETRIDLLNEGAPGDYLTRQVTTWISRMYANYVDAFGADDVTVSAGFWTGMSGLIQALKASGKPMPRWFDVHPRWDPALALQDLRAVDAELSANDLSQPLVIGEERYNDPAVAAAIAEFIGSSARRIDEVMEWPLYQGGAQPANQQSRCISPPYQLGAYATELRGAPPPTTLSATISDQAITFRTRYGQAVSALLAGTYTVSVSDTSRLRGFLLDNRRTTAPFHGTVTWKLALVPGTHTFGATGRSPTGTTFIVMAPG